MKALDDGIAMSKEHEISEMIERVGEPPKNMRLCGDWTGYGLVCTTTRDTREPLSRKGLCMIDAIIRRYNQR